MIATPYLMVVTCGNENFKLPHSNFCKISLFLLFGENFSFRKNFFAKTFIRRFSFFFAKIFFFFSFLFCFCHLSCIYIYILYISKTIKQSKLFGANFCGFSVLWIFISAISKNVLLL